MKTRLSISLTPEEGFHETRIENALRKKLGLDQDEKIIYKLRKRSIDARNRNIRVLIELEVYQNELPELFSDYQTRFENVSNADPVIIVGSGPAGLFAALKLIENGLKPIILERGKDVRSRRRDIAAINRKHIVNPDSNYCFGEGGAGTYSDGKLYTRSKKRGDVRKVLETFVSFGANENILFEAHPHIGTNKLPQIIQNIREAIIAAGGEIYFESKVVDFKLDSNRIKHVVTTNGDKFSGRAVILATGHSARDIFELLQRKGIHIESKPFALGVRVEHPQSLIDKIQYHCDFRGPDLPAAAYSLVTQTDYTGIQRGVFSFCMCPGGFIVPAATAEGEIVVNGMSPSRRDSKYANSGIVAAVELDDLKDYMEYGPLMSMQFQKEIERKACLMSGGDQTAPGQCMVDFVEGRTSSSLPDCSYKPGIKSVDLNSVLPDFISRRLSFAFKQFGTTMKGYFTNEALIVGVESRTSSPIRINRNKESYEHIQIKDLYPCGEGAGYAGGIVSAAIDGMNCAEILSIKYGSKTSLV